MNKKYLYILVTLLMVGYFVPASAQTKKPAAKTTQKPAAKKPAARKPGKASTAAQQKVNAKNLGDAASTVAADTTRKGGKADPTAANNSGLSEEIVVNTSYKPVLAEAVKIRRNPDLEEVSPFKAPLAYAPMDKKLQQDNNIRELDAMKRPAEQDSVLLNNYVKAGAGSMKTTYAEGYFSNGRDQALQVGGFVKHFAQSGNLEKQKESREEVGIFGKTITGDNSLTGRINYKRRGTYFYGFDQNAPAPSGFDPAKQTFNTISAEGELAKNYKDVENDFTYAAKIQGYLFSNAYAARENNLVLSGFLNQTVKQFYAGVSASLDLSTQKDNGYDLSNSLVRANPYIKFQGENYKIDGGINIVKEFGFSSRFFIFPAAKLEFQVVPKYVRLFAEAKGDVNRASIKDFAETNPFIQQDILLVNSVDQLDIAVGLKGTLAPGLAFKATVFRNNVKNLPMYISTGNLPGAPFAVIYDGGKTRVSGFNGELDFKATEDFDLFGRVEFKDYKMATEARPWNLPKFRLTAGTTIHISDKIDINGALLFRGSTMDPQQLAGSTPSSPAYTTIPSFADLNGGAAYKVNKKLSVFVQVNNILNSSNQVWLNYPNYGLNVFGGVGYAF